MITKTKILIVEHDPVDIELLYHALNAGEISYESQVVQTRPDYLEALKTFTPDIILSDYTLPSFSGTAAFEIKEKITPDTPFIFVSGTIGEEKSVELIKSGVTDYALKDKLFTLSPKIKRALKEAKEKQLKTKTDLELVQKGLEVSKVLKEKNIILESIDDAFFAVDKDWIVTYWNKQAEKVLGKSKAEMTDHNLWDVFSESIDSKSYKKYQQAVETGQSIHFEDFYPPLAKWYEISAYPSGNGLSVYFKDISERKISEIQMGALNENLQKQARALVISNIELEQFAYVASHDLQEPLRMVTSFLTQLEKRCGDQIDEKGKKYIGFAVNGAKRMRQIILDLLDFSRVGRTGEKQELLDLNEVVKEIQMLFRKQIQEENAVIIVDDLPQLHVHRSPIRQVFQNLISNALKYSRKDIPSEIHISAKERDTEFQITVSDNGIGIAREYFDKIFIIFQRLHNKDEYSGTGMGLAVTKKIIEQEGGRIWVESEEGKGTSFFFTLKK